MAFKKFRNWAKKAARRRRRAAKKKSIGAPTFGKAKELAQQGELSPEMSRKVLGSKLNSMASDEKTDETNNNDATGFNLGNLFKRYGAYILGGIAVIVGLVFTTKRKGS